MDAAPPSLDPEDLKQLQQALLAAALTGRPLPGSRRALDFPDLHFLLDKPTVPVLDQNLAGSLAVEGAPKPVEVLSQREIDRLTEVRGDTPYFQFQPPEVQGEVVRLTLEAKIAQRRGSQASGALGLSAVQVSFRRTDGRWEVAGDPAALAF